MKCKDCLKEIDDKEYYNRSLEGVCKKCRQKISQIKYENKKFGTNKEYIPSRLKDNNTKKIVSRQTNKVVANTKIIETKEERIYSKEIENRVLQDIDNTFKNNKVFIDSQKLPPFNVFMDMFCSLIDIENGYMSEYMKAEDIFNRMETDYRHAYEDANTNAIFNERSQMYRCLLDKRRTVKNGLGQYSKIIRMLQEIVQGTPDILDKAKQSKINLDEIIKMQENHSYKIESSELIASLDFCTGRKEVVNEYAKYLVTVPVYNLYGNTGRTEFQRAFFANSPEEAKQMTIDFLKVKFPKVTYKPVDIIATKVIESDEEESVEKVCL